MQDALAAVVAAKDLLFGEIFRRLDHALDAGVADLGDQRVKRPRGAFGNLIRFFEHGRTTAWEVEHADYPRRVRRSRTRVDAASGATPSTTSGTGIAPVSTCFIMRMCSGPLPQQPPISATPCCCTRSA